MLVRAPEPNDKVEGVEIVSTAYVCVGAKMCLSTTLCHQCLYWKTSWTVNESHTQARPCYSRTHAAKNLCHVKSSRCVNK